MFKNNYTCHDLKKAFSYSFLPLKKLKTDSNDSTFIFKHPYILLITINKDINKKTSKHVAM